MTALERTEAPRAALDATNAAAESLQKDAYATHVGSDKSATTNSSTSQNHLPDLLLTEGIQSQQSSVTHDKQGDTITTALAIYPPGQGITSQQTINTQHTDGSSIEQATLYNGKTPTSLTDWIQSANDSAHPTSVSRNPLTGQVTAVDNFANNTEVTFDPKTGKPDQVDTMYPNGGPLHDSLVYLNPSTGKPTSERVWSNTNVESDYNIDPKSGALTPTKLKPL